VATTSDREGDYNVAIEYWTKAAALGNSDAHHNLSVRYVMGKVLRGMKKRQSTIRKRLPLVDTLALDSILE
jgi:TPR repeat protein